MNNRPTISYVLLCANMIVKDLYDLSYLGQIFLHTGTIRTAMVVTTAKMQTNTTIAVNTVQEIWSDIYNHKNCTECPFSVFVFCTRVRPTITLMGN